MSPCEEPRVIIDSQLTQLKTCRHGLMLYFKNDQYIGRSLDIYGEYSESEISLFREIVVPDSIVVEAGANIGTHTLFLARAVGPSGMVHAFEPQRRIHQMLCANLALNEIGNTRTYQAGLGSIKDKIEMWEPDLESTINLGGIPIGQIEGEVRHDIVDIMTLDELDLPRVDFLKIDVEGMERDVLLGASSTIQRCRPIIYLENDRSEKSPALIQTLFDLGYRAWWHRALFFNPANFQNNEANPFGYLISINLLCLPRELEAEVNNMDEVMSVDDTDQGKRILGVY